jgi:hypothetical protein
MGPGNPLQAWGGREAENTRRSLWDTWKASLSFPQAGHRLGCLCRVSKNKGNVADEHVDFGPLSGLVHDPDD